MEVVVKIDGDLKKVVDDLTDKKDTCYYGMEELARKGKDYSQQIWESIRFQHPEVTKGDAYSYDKSTGNVSLLFKKRTT